MNKHVTSKELSKRLYDLGVRVESEFYWVGNGYEDTIMWELGKLEDFGEHIKPNDDEVYPALLSSELGELLPNYISLKHSDGEPSPLRDHELTIMKDFDGSKNIWLCNYYKEFPLHIRDKNRISIYSNNDSEHENEAEARGLMLEYLLENKLIELNAK